MTSESLSCNNGVTEFLNFSDALHHLRWGERVARRQWPAGKYLKVNYKRPIPRVEVYWRGLNFPVTWSSASDESNLLAEDWYVLGEHQ